ncbi:MAG: hypothetical protein ACYC27_15950 [Armatimonadota bacterium]
MKPDASDAESMERSDVDAAAEATPARVLSCIYRPRQTCHFLPVSK